MSSKIKSSTSSSALQTHQPSSRQRVCKLFPGASLGEYNLPPDLSTVLVSGSDCRAADTDGKEYVDMTMG